MKQIKNSQRPCYALPVVSKEIERENSRWRHPTQFGIDALLRYVELDFGMPWPSDSHISDLLGVYFKKPNHKDT
jgi:hypothetical protein